MICIFSKEIRQYIDIAMTKYVVHVYKYVSMYIYLYYLFARSIKREKEEEEEEEMKKDSARMGCVCQIGRHS